MADIFYFCGHEQFQPEVLLEHAIAAEKAGFDGIAVSEHFNPWVSDKGAAGFAFSTLGAIAARTERIKLMTTVVTPLFRYHPAVVAQAAATIDRLSGGRFILGVGTGEALNETPLGYTYPGYQERYARMQEALQIMYALFKHTTPLSYKGKYYSTEEVMLYSPPVHPIPLLLAAGGKQTADLASKSADGIIMSVKDIEEVKRVITRPDKKAFNVVASKWTIYANSPEAAWQALMPWRGLRSPHRDTTTSPLLLQQDADNLPHQEILSKYTILSSAEAYINAYTPLISDLHADTVMIQTTGTGNQLDLIAMLGKEVLPELKHID